MFDGVRGLKTAGTATEQVSLIITLFSFEIEIEDLTGLIEAYQKRTYVEDIDYLQQNLGGM